MLFISSTIKYIPGKDNAEEFGTSLSSVYIGGRLLCNLPFADDIDLLGGSKEELQQLTKRL